MILRLGGRDLLQKTTRVSMGYAGWSGLIVLWVVVRLALELKQATGLSHD